MRTDAFTGFARITRSLPLKYFLMALLPMCVLLYTPISNYIVLQFGEKILLETRPVDPRDILRGDYVVLEYEIENIPDEMMPEEVRNEYDYRARGRDVYVSLVRDGDGIATVSSVSMERPQGPFLKAKVVTSWRFAGNVDYNLGVYYVPEGTGRELEDAIRENRVLADVRVLRGRGVIKKLEVRED